jgi:hypothetical protein
MRRDADHVLPFTRWLAIALVPFLLVASVLLFVFPTRTDTLFAWTIRPPLTAMFLACAYIGGIWFFCSVAVARKWHTVRPGFPAVVFFATLLGISTLIHFDKFHAGTFIFAVWLVLYVTTPFIAVVALVVNSRDGVAATAHDYLIPLWLRTVLIGVGVCCLITGVALFVFPELALGWWAWEVTPLTAQVIGAILTLPGMVNLAMVRERRWSAYSRVFQAQLVSLSCIALALIIGAGDLLWDRVSAWLFVGGIGVALVAFTVTYRYCTLQNSAARISVDESRERASRVPQSPRSET